MLISQVTRMFFDETKAPWVCFNDPDCEILAHNHAAPPPPHTHTQNKKGIKLLGALSSPFVTGALARKLLLFCSVFVLSRVVANALSRLLFGI